ncbi:MAG: DUF6020 family protein [Eubacteriales bacterium]|nr:DUF6020 family protein [Eubacteriales bacterium]
MQPTRAGWKTPLLALLWALSVAAFCVSLTGTQPNAATGADTVGWSRTLPGMGVGVIATVALGLGYRLLGRVRRGLWQPGLWVLALFFAAVVTLGESFAYTGTAELIAGQKGLALLYFAGRVPVFYMGMALLLEALSRTEVPPGDGRAKAPSTGGAPKIPAPKTAWIEGEQPNLRKERKPYQPPRPEWAKRTPGEWTGRNEASVPAEAAAGETGAHAAAAAPYRRETAETARGAWDYQALPENTAASPARRGMPTWGFLLLLLACWLPYLFIVWPGTVSNDSITQLAEIFGVKALETGNPLAQTGLLWLAVQAGQGLFGSADAAVALYVCVQAALMAWLLGYTLKRISETRAPRWLVWLATAFYAVCPIFPLFAFCVGKDTVFAMAVLWFTLMVWRVIGSKWPPLRTMVGLCLSAAACALLRNAGAALAGVTLVALLIRVALSHTRQWHAPVAALLAMAVSMVLLYAVVVPGLSPEPAAETENWSVPLQQVARVAAGGTLTDEERTVVDAVLPVDELQAAYNGELSDPVKALWRGMITAEQRSRFFSLWLRLGIKYPSTYLSAFFHNTYGYLTPGYVSTIKPTFLLGMEGRTTLIDGRFDFTVNERAVALKTALQNLFNCAPFRLLCAPGLYGWLTLFALIGVLGCRRRRNVILLLPALITLLGCLFSAVNGYFRYAMPLYFMAPVLLALVSDARLSGRRMMNRV